MTKQEYLDCCYQQLLKIFQLASQHKKDDKQKFRTEGFIHAGKVLGIISHKEAAAVMSQAHFDVFGQSIDAHRNQKTSLRAAIERGDDSYIDIPAYVRAKPKPKA